MQNARFLECLAGDYARILAVVPGHLEASVPTCPGWTVADLTRHLAETYLHKVTSMRAGGQPEEWPPPGLAAAEPVALLERAYTELIGELTSRSPEEIVGTWYGPDQSVGFWIRRMAQETVIHRIDAELGADAPVAAVPDDLAVDGIDELLRVFVAYAISEWPEDFTSEWPADSAGAPASPGSWTYAIKTDGASWLVKTTAGQFEVSGGPGVGAADASAADIVVRGAPGALLRWAWNRALPGIPSALTMAGNLDALRDFRQYVTIATQ